MYDIHDVLSALTLIIITVALTVAVYVGTAILIAEVF